ncbi:DNA-binding response regulator [Bifidobacterium lemurum]|uniref:DNA-binding response regulator n=1 Tax=Bifidobacterium lemurum TaxID=1603886 RepID=A0A261FSB5_9BIFI|nr:LytTR family DNA-binding domain-containing protein [Bifidobacterium lemurum]OZG61968.1 DNA-binding response regulator [Bifidobacterium lemurum]QOL35254.1 response regulator transcription factor [Bifidobacterium lemurum]
MYTLAVVDDDRLQREALVDTVNRVGAEVLGPNMDVLSFSGVGELERHLADRASRRLDIVLMDIALRNGSGGDAGHTTHSGDMGGSGDPNRVGDMGRMGNVNDAGDACGGSVRVVGGDLDAAAGIDAVRRLFPPSCGTQVIYVTGHIEYCTRVYNTDHVSFLLKPVRESDLRDALARAAVRLREESERPIGVRVGNAEYSVTPRDIIYAESRGRISRIHTERGVIESYLKLDELSARLPSRFVRCHKSYLVNLAYVWRFQSAQMELSNGVTVPVSQRRAAQAREAFLSYVR